ncbi:LytTR family DNA-binding domain-containing protein [Neolewinella lacunae]|uniref:LytR/AlgR family response regulator transcription factor n=1 Tax=Neolewinella lacunae TaxID=1517758 RepID=UPI001FE8A584|nr:LytTR family DNA-binding domain-containing protein [Neolewinella lacunae]MDN3636175.1 LytTR family DNA-binding domain-containing protein [Neolewinella lacunae]
MGKYCPDTEVVGEADGVAQALERIRETQPDLLFLDIEMPYGNGFDLLEQLPVDHGLEIVFVTAYEQYALRALRLSAAHYLLKPVDIDDLIEAVAKVKARLGLREQGRVTQALLQNLREQNRAVPERLALPLLDGLEIVSAADIRYCSAADNFTDFHLADGRKLLICRKLKFYADLLEPAGFFRIHRSHLVNLQRVRRYHRGSGGSVVLDDGTELLVAAARKAELLELLAG